MKYCVYITELHYGSVHVEAETDDEAVQKARELYEQGHALWYDYDLAQLSPVEESA